MRPFAAVLVGCTVLSGCASAGPPAPRPPTPDQLARLEAQALRDTAGIDAQLRLASAYRAQGRLQEALAVAEKAAARRPDHARAALLAGLTREDLGDYAGARELYGRALRTTTSPRLRSELKSRLVLLQRRESQALVKDALARETELARTPPRPRSVAVFPLAVPGAPDSVLEPLGRALTGMLIADLARTDRLTVLDRTVVQLLADEIRLAEVGYVDERTAARGGRLLGAERIVQGSLASAEDRLRLDAAVVLLAPAPAPPPRADSAAAPRRAEPRRQPPARKAPPAQPQKAAPAAPPRQAPAAAATLRTARLSEADRLEALFDMQKRLTLRIYAAAGVELTPAERAAVMARPTDNVQAVLAYGRGLLATDAGDFDAAVRLFSEAARLDPAFAPARQEAAAARSLVGASQLTTQQLAAVAERAAATVQAAAAAVMPFVSLGRDALAELLGTEGTTARTGIELVIRRPGGTP